MKIEAPPSLPRATYRLQFSKDFRFDDARKIIPYLSALGVSHVYASPLLMARPGSTHGYDIVDHNRFNPEIGEFAEFDALISELHDHGMGLILDFVPNHMWVGPDNRWWVDVLEWGPASHYAEFFDIDWQPQEPTLAGKVLLPVLGDHYGAVLERGELQLRLNADEGIFTVDYFDNPFPIAPSDYPWILQAAGERSDEMARHLDAIAADLRACLQGGRSKRAHMTRRQRVAEFKQRLAETLATDAPIKQAIEDAIGDINGRPGDRESFDRLHQLLDLQAYRLAFWRVAAHEINYRRFFDINELAGLKMEQPELFDESHGLVGLLLADGKIQGMRLDHIDGLRDPYEYLERLQRLATTAGSAAGRGGRNRAEDGPLPLYVLVEKILAPHESLRSDWAASGTTGYDFMSDVNGLFVDRSGERPLTRFYERLYGSDVDFEEMVVAAKRQIMHQTLVSELNVLANAFNKLAKQNRSSRDFSLMGLRDALTDIVAHFPVYRTYVTDRDVTSEDRRDLEWAIGKARRAERTPDTSIYDFVYSVLTLELLDDEQAYKRRDVIDTALKFQQYTGPVMAKAMEDTAFYRYARLVSQNEVGGEPDRFGIDPGAFHEANLRRQQQMPFSMLSTATHDHKRGEDVRARLNVISEVPRQWTKRVQRWIELNESKRVKIDGRSSPSRNDEYIYYQTLVGAWPHELVPPDFAGVSQFSDRIDAYMLKAAREAKSRTSWVAPNEAYEEALSEFVKHTLDPEQSGTFLEDVYEFVDQISATGAVNGLSQVLLKLVCPGVPDTYQGSELWDLSLVDPDNRRPVDFGERQKYARAGGSASPEDLLENWRGGRIKQHVIMRALDVRRRQPDLFVTGEYRPLQATGSHEERVTAVARTLGDQIVIAVVPRLVWPLIQDHRRPLANGWGTTRLLLPDALPRNQTLTDVMTQQEVPISDDGTLDVKQILSSFPVALLVGD